MPEPRFAGKVALVTGGGRGIGRAISLRLGREGALVAVHFGADEAAAARVVAEIVAAGGAAFKLRADTGSLADITTMFAALDAELARRGLSARFDVLVNNAGIAPPGLIAETTEAEFDRVMAVNLKGPYFIMQQAIPRLRDGGRIVNVTSIASITGRKNLGVYGASKAGLNLMTKSVAAQLGPRQITVNAVAPGAVDTDINRIYVDRDPDIYAKVAQGIALGRVALPEDISGIVVFLAGPDGGWINGQTIFADGGQER